MLLLLWYTNASADNCVELHWPFCFAGNELCILYQPASRSCVDISMHSQRVQAKTSRRSAHSVHVVDGLLLLNQA